MINTMIKSSTAEINFVNTKDGCIPKIKKFHYFDENNKEIFPKDKEKYNVMGHVLEFNLPDGFCKKNN